MKTSVATLLIATPCNGYTDPYGVDPERDDLSTIDCSNYNGMCTREYMPICRNDGHTSSNVCVFLSEYCMGNVNLRFWKWANMDGGELCPKMLNDGGINDKKEEKEEEEEEQCNLNCPRMLDFVCGTDGVKYPNPCILKGKACQEKTDVRVAFRTLTGDCCPKFCSRIGLPVCGSDGKTYGNECMLGVAACAANKDPEMENIWMDYEGACEKPEMQNDGGIGGFGGFGDDFKEPKCKTNCGRIVKQVCGNDGVTYPNTCMLKLKKCEEGPRDLAVKHKGKCATKCDEACPMIHSPVCGSDGETYANECELKVSNCKAKKQVFVKHEGECKAPCNEACVMIYAPVCGSDGRTYSNECALEVEQCKSGNDIVVEHEGECCARQCTRQYAPVCGTDGITYSTECTMLEYACFNKDKNIQKAYSGACMANDVTIDNKPEEATEMDCEYHLSRTCSQFSNKKYCGSDGNYYYNICRFKKAQCNDSSLSVARNEKVCKRKLGGKNSLLSRIGGYRAFEVYED